jgi:hypothetical protein
VEFSAGTFPVRWVNSGLWTRESPTDVMVACADTPRTLTLLPEDDGGDIPTPRTAFVIGL